MPDLTTEQLTIALAVAGGLALLALLLCLVLMARIRRVRREYAVIRGEGEARDVIKVMGDTVGRVKELQSRIEGIARSQEDLAMVGRMGIQRFALVRYDAFEDMGGQLSFSAALLDDYGDGLVVTSINGRTETRTYAKAIKDMKSQHNLSEEELEALGQAAAGDGRAGSEPTSARAR